MTSHIHSVKYKREGNVLTLAAVFIALIFVMSASFYAGQKYFQMKSQVTNFVIDEQKKSPTSNETVSTEKTQNVGWKTINNSEQGYLIKIPPSWIQVEHSSNFPNLDEFQSPDKSQIRILTYKNETDTLQDYLSKTDKLNATGYEGTPSKITLSTKNVTVDGQNGIQRREDWPAAGFETDSVYVKNGSNIYVITIFPADPDPKIFNQLEAVKIFPQLLSTVKFTNQSNCDVNDGELCKLITLTKKWTTTGEFTEETDYQSPIAMTCYSNSANVMPPPSVCTGKPNGEVVNGYEFGRNQSEGDVMSKDNLQEYLKHYNLNSGQGEFLYKGTISKYGKASIIYTHDNSTLLAFMAKQIGGVWKIQYPMLGGASNDFLQLKETVLTYIK